MILPISLLHPPPLSRMTNKNFILFYRLIKGGLVAANNFHFHRALKFLILVYLYLYADRRGVVRGYAEENTMNTRLSYAPAFARQWVL